MDRRRGALNVGASLASRAILFVATLLVRRQLIQHIGSDANGLSSLYASIIGTLAVAELGIGSAITFSMYAPIVEGDVEKVAALYRLYERLYRIVGAFILLAGLAVTPFLPAIISDYSTLNINVYVTYLITLVASVLSYAYGAQTSLIEAHKDNYLTTAIHTLSALVSYALQAAVILAWGSFEAFLACQLVGTLLSWAATTAVARHRHGGVIATHASLDAVTRSEVTRSIKAMFMHKVGTVLVNTVDSLVISTFVGVVALGRYSNYALVASTLASTAGLFFTPLTSVIGHLCAEGDRTAMRAQFDRLYALNLTLGMVLFLGYYATVDHVVALVLGPGLEMFREIPLAIALNQFIQYLRKATLLFRNASGTFYHDRWKPIAEGVANLCLSLVLVNILPEEYRVVGVIVATILTNLAICHVVEPYVVFHHAFGQPALRFCLRNYAGIVLFGVCLVAIGVIARPTDNHIAGLLVNGALSLCVSAGAITLVAMVDKTFRDSIHVMANELRGRLSRP